MKPLPRFFPALLLALLLAPAEVPGRPDAELMAGLAVVTGRAGDVTLLRENGQRLRPSLHADYALTGATIRTGRDAHLFLALSNGMGIGVGARSKLVVETYRQKPFSEDRAGLTLEPSRSTLTLRLLEGRVAVASQKLSPLSQVRVRLPVGTARVHDTTGILEIDDTGTRVTAYSGTLTFLYDNADDREFLVNPQSIRITRQSAALGRVAEMASLDALSENAGLLARAARHSSKRVFFRAGIPPEPVFVVPPDYYAQPPARPYGFRTP